MALPRSIRAFGRNDRYASSRSVSTPRQSDSRNQISTRCWYVALFRSYSGRPPLAESIPTRTVLNTHSTASTDRQADVPNLSSLNLDDETANSTPPEVDIFKPHFSVYVAPAFTTYGEYRGGVPKSADIFIGIKPNNVPPGPGEGQDRWLWSKADSHFFSDDSCDFWGEPTFVSCSISLLIFWT